MISKPNMEAAQSMEIVEPAKMYDAEWTGTVAAEKSVIVGRNDLYELAGLDPHLWSIVGVDMWLFNHVNPPSWDVHVYACDRQVNEVRSHEDMKRVEATRGSLPVKDVRLHGISADDILRCMKTVQVQFLSRDFQKLDVVAHGDHPEQG